MNLKSYTDSPEIKHAQLAEMDFRVRKEDYRFYQDLEVPCYQSDNRTALKPSSFMDMAQEIAYWAAQDLGFGYDTLHIHHTAWVLSRMHLHFVKMPLWRDVVRLYTWHKGANGLFYLRDFELKDADGEVLATATSSWVVIDERTRRFVRPEDIDSYLRQDYEVADAIAEPAPKIVFPKDGDQVPAGEHTVAFSDVDLIGHTNNARYMDWAMDCLPYELVSTRPVRDAWINFNRETTPGTSVQLFRMQTGPDQWFVEGRVDGKSCFTVRLDF